MHALVVPTESTKVAHRQLSVKPALGASIQFPPPAHHAVLALLASTTQAARCIVKIAPEGNSIPRPEPRVVLAPLGIAV